MENKIFDCAIIGGGLAGLTLSIQLAGAGYAVILFEKEKYPFHKVCGEYVSMESFGFLQRLGLPLKTMNLPIITEVMVSAPNGNTLTRKLGLGGLGISRYTLDSSLATLARSKGVTLMENTKVTDVNFDNDGFTIATGTESFHAKITCGAYGKKTSLDRLLARQFEQEETAKGNYVAVKYHVNIGPPDNRIELHNFKNGYCGISKVDGDKYCLCYLSDSSNLRSCNNNIKEMEKRVLMQNPFLRQYFSEATFLNERPYTISQVTFNKKSAVDKHVLMIGDSAGTIAPLCGNGMSMAMRASCHASLLIKEYLDGNINRAKLELDYMKQWDRLFSNRIKAGVRLQKLFGKEKLTNIAIGILKHTPMITDRLIRLTHGEPF